MRHTAFNTAKYARKNTLIIAWRVSSGKKAQDIQIRLYIAIDKVEYSQKINERMNKLIMVPILIRQMLLIVAAL